MELSTKLRIKDIVNLPNIAEKLDEDELNSIGQFVLDGFKRDKDSRADWEDRMADALRLAMQVVEEKTFPWSGASNVKFPLLTIAALQYHARAYPALIPNPRVVKCATYGDDPTGQRVARAERIAHHMSFQVLEEDCTWEENMDRVLITQPILGCVFKKSYFDPYKNHNVSDYILPSDLVVDYWTKSLDTAQRISHVLRMFPNDIHERVVRGLYYDWGEEFSKPAPVAPDPIEEAEQEAHGISVPIYSADLPYDIIEQHCWIDFDQDGYAEPYVVTIRQDNGQVLRIVARYFEDGVTYSGNDVVHIKPENYFTKFPFIPSPDGSFYDLGFGLLLGPLNSSIDTLVNQLIDSGTMANTAGGFLGRGVKIKGGDYEFKPLEWKRVDSTGDDLRKNIFPLPVREPSQVLFTLLELLINYGERVAFATEATSGINPGQNTPAETSRNMLEQGLKIFNGIYKRTYRALKEEFKKLFRLNQLYYEDSRSDSRVRIALPGDYLTDDLFIRPAADPNMVSDAQRQQQAMMLRQASMSVPGYNHYEVEKRFLEAIQIPDVEKVYPDPKGPNAIPPPVNPKVQIEQMKVEAKQMEQQLKLRIAVMEMMQEAELNKAKIMEMEARTVKELAEAKGVESGHQIALVQAQIGAAKAHQDSVLKQIKIMQDALSDKLDIEMRKEELNAARKERVGRMAEEPSYGDVPSVPTA